MIIFLIAFCFNCQSSCKEGILLRASQTYTLKSCLPPEKSTFSKFDVEKTKRKDPPTFCCVPTSNNLYQFFSKQVLCCVPSTENLHLIFIFLPTANGDKISFKKEGLPSSECFNCFVRHLGTFFWYSVSPLLKR